ncbi:MAG: sigma-70 family RNA polymerase sigma factor [Planctomycetes bacterium]|nr:sigma-70 family RNA polymerase sigma factor [Planctomycetota bacterium]
MEPTQAPLAERSSEELLELFLEGKRQDAFAELVTRFQHSAYRVAFARCGRPQLAEEAVQNAFLKLAAGKARPKYLDAGGFRIWFLSVVSNEARDVSKTERRTSQRLEHPKLKENVRIMENARSEPNSGLDDDSRSALLKELGALDEGQRTPLILHFMEGLTQEKVGEMMGLSQSGVARRIADGLKALRLRLSQSGMAVIPALPLALGDSGLLQAPASLQRVLCDPQLLAKAGALRLAAHSTRAKAAAGLSLKTVLVGVLVVASAGAGIFLYLPKDEPVTPPAPPAQRADPAAEVILPAPAPEEAVAVKRSWDFAQKPGAADFTLHHGKWRWRKDMGVKNSACLEIEAYPALFEVEQPLPKLPMLLTFRVRPAVYTPAQENEQHTVLVRWSYRDQIAEFNNVGANPQVNVEMPNQWVTMEVFMTEDFIALYTDGILVDFRVCKPKPGTKFHITCWGNFRFDNMTLEAPAKHAAPGTTELLKAIERLPLAERNGMKTLSDLPVAVKGKPVVVWFPSVPLK